MRATLPPLQQQLAAAKHQLALLTGGLPRTGPAGQPARIAGRAAVPPEVVQTEGDAGFVYVIRGNAVERRAVRLGARTADGQTIVAGLQPGTLLALGDFSKLGDHSRVSIIQ